MASVQFRIHTDKENATSSGLKMGGENLQQGGKSFQAHKTPRRALGSVNEAHRVGLGAKVPASRDEKSSAGGSVSAKSVKPKNVNGTDSKLKNRQQLEDNIARKGKHQGEENARLESVHCKLQPSSASYSLPDIEYIPPRSPPRDEDEDFLPIKDRASTYVNKLLSWRPQCLFGSAPDSDEEEEERERQRIMEELDNLPVPDDVLFPPANLHLSCEELDLDDLDLPTMDDAVIPFMDDNIDDALQDHWQNVSANVSLPELDDSLGLAGSLELRNLSLTPTLSTSYQ